MLKLMAAIVVLLSATQASVPLSRQTPDDNRGKTHNAQGESGSSQEKSTNPKTIPQPPQSDEPQRKPEAANGENNHQSVAVGEEASVPKRDWLDYTTLCIGLFLALITGAGVIAAWKGLPDFKRQARAAEDAGAAALKQARHIETSERAWVFANAQPPTPPLPASSDAASMSAMVVSVFIFFENKGKTPAFITKVATGGCAISRDQAPNLADAQEWGELGGIPVAPERSFGWEHERITIDRTIKIRTGELSLWVYGIVSYDDSFGGHRDTGFCYRFDPSKGEWLISGPNDANWAA